MVRGGLKDRAKPAARVLDPAPPCCRGLRCSPHSPLTYLPPCPVTRSHKLAG
jgi:hypothetical protein